MLKLNAGLLAENDKLVVAVSGGIDSMVLLHLLAEVKDDFGLTLIVCHVNHHTREACEKEEMFVRQTCEKYGLPIEVLHYRQKDDDNFHQSSRKARYEFFYQVAQKVQADKIVLAHQADDLVETILMRIVRGSSLAGYSGIAKRSLYRGIEVIRPLLTSSREDIVAYQQEHHIEYMEDESNQKDFYTRNRFRHHVIPLIKAENPAYAKKFAQFSEYVGQAHDLVFALANQFISANVVFTENQAKVSSDKLSLEMPIIRKEIIKLIIDKVSRDSVEVSYSQFLNLDGLVGSDKTYAEVDVDNFLTVVKSYDSLFFYRSLPDPIQYEFRIDGPGEIRLPDGGVLSISTNNSNYNGKSHELWYNNLDYVFPLIVRNRRNGDRVETACGTKKVKDLFIQKKVPHADRNALPVVVGKDNRIVWIPSCYHQNRGQGKMCLYLSYRKGK